MVEIKLKLGLNYDLIYGKMDKNCNLSPLKLLHVPEIKPYIGFHVITEK